MARLLYINPDKASVSYAAGVGCGWAPAVPVEFASVATAPCIIIAGQGITTVLPATATSNDVADALAPITALENAARATAMQLATNAESLRAKASAALTANATFLAIASPTNAQTLAQVQRLTRECTALIRLLIGDVSVDDA